MIWFFSLCFLMSLANGLSILFIFSRNQLLTLLIFAMVSFVSFAFISALILKISFLLLNLGFFISSLSSFFRCKVWLMSFTVLCFVLFLNIELLLINNVVAVLVSCVCKVSQLYIYMYLFFNFFFPFRLLQSIELSSLF